MTTTPAQIHHALRAFPDLHQAIVFGSVVAGTARHDSDIDIAVEGTHALSAQERTALIEALAAATGRAIDLIDIKTAGEPLLGQILQHGHRVLGSDAQYAELVRRHVFDTQDFLPYAERLLRERRQTWIG